MTPDRFALLLERACVALSSAAQGGESGFDNPRDFEKRVLAAIEEEARESGLEAKLSWHQHAFPDIVVNGYGVEVKHTNKDSWLAVANSIFEGMRDESAHDIHVVFGKMGGWPEVRSARYEDCITHVRISHAPRFCVEMDRVSPLFCIMGVSYSEFRRLSPEEKMRYVREYSRNRLKPGERLWWLEDREEQEHALPFQVRIYMRLTQEEKLMLRAEAAVLCPQVCGPSRKRGKYDDAAMYLLTHHGVFCPQTRDLFSAGSVALRADDRRGGNYVLRALKDIETHMRDAAQRLDDSLFIEYWGRSCPPRDRIAEWLKRADSHAGDWKPSHHLFCADR